MKQTLIDIRDLYRGGREPDPKELAAAIDRRMPQNPNERARYLRGMGAFLGQALAGLVIDPETWAPPD